MLIIDDLLFWLPLKGVRWVLEQVKTAADREMTDEQPIMQAILENELAFEEGRVEKATYEAKQDELMARLRAIRELKKAEAEADAAARGPIAGPAKLEVDLDFEGYGR